MIPITTLLETQYVEIIENREGNQSYSTLLLVSYNTSHVLKMSTP